MTRALLAVVSLFVSATAGVAEGPVAEASPGCAVDGVARMGRSRAELRGAAIAAVVSTDERCAGKAMLLADWLDRAPGPHCGPLRDMSRADVDELALEAALSWRCGRAERAHALAVEAARRDVQASLAWIVLGRVLVARSHMDAAWNAFLRAAQADPASCTALWFLSGLADEREEMIAYALGYLDAAAACEEPLTRRTQMNERIALLEALADTRIWVREKVELPARLKLQPYTQRPPRISGWTLRSRLGARKNVRVLIDSGASGLHVAENVAKKAGLQAMAAGTLIGGGGDGLHDVQAGLVSTLDLGPLVFAKPVARVAEGSLHPSGAFQAILGLDVFAGMEVTLDAHRGRLILETAAGAWETGDDPLRVDPWNVPPDWIPLLRVEGQMLAPVEIDGERFWGVLDTGASQTLLALAVAEGLKNYRPGSRRRIGAYGGRIAPSGTLAHGEFELAGETFDLREISAIDLSDRSRLTGFPVGGLWGWDLIERNKITFDLRNGAFRIDR